MSRNSFSGLLSSIRSAFCTVRGIRYLFRLATGKRMGFSLRGPLGLRLHFNSSGALRSFSLKSFGGMRAVYGSNGRFKGLSIPGILKGSRIFTNSRGELTGFGLPRLFGGFLIFNNKAELKRIYSPVFGGVCFSHGPDGTKKKHKLKGIKKHSFIESEARTELPETSKSFTRKGEVTEKGIVPISEKDVGMFNIKQKGRKTEHSSKVIIERDTVKHGDEVVSHKKDNENGRISNNKESDSQMSHEQQFSQENITSYLNNAVDRDKKVDSHVVESTNSFEDNFVASTPMNQSFSNADTVDELSRHMIETERAVEEAFSGQEEIPFDEYCAVTKKNGNDD